MNRNVAQKIYSQHFFFFYTILPVRILHNFLDAFSGILHKPVTQIITMNPRRRLLTGVRSICNSEFTTTLQLFQKTITGFSHLNVIGSERFVTEGTWNDYLTYLTVGWQHRNRVPIKTVIFTSVQDGVIAMVCGRVPGCAPLLPEVQWYAWPSFYCS